MQEYSKIVKSDMYNKDKRCYHCDGTLASVSGFGDSISLPIRNDKLIIRYKYWTQTSDAPDGEERLQMEDLKAISINFCPYCGCQLRKKVDWSLCD